MQATRIQSTLMVILCCIAFTSSTQAQVCGIPQPESGVECVKGQVVQLAYGDYTFCWISPAVDTDVFEFEGAEGDLAQFTILGTTDFFDPRIEVFDPNGVFIHRQDCDGSPTCGFVFNLELKKSGTYTIIVSDNGSNETGDYILQLERIPPPTDPPAIFHGLSLSDSIIPATDIDFLTFEGVAGTTIRITVLGKTNFFDPSLYWRQPDGTVLTDSCSGNPTCTFSVTETLLVSGTNLLVLQDSGRNEAGGYQVDLKCLSGPCKCLEADLDGDGNVGILDLLQLLAKWYQTCNADFVAPPGVDILDLLALLVNWGQCP